MTDPLAIEATGLTRTYGKRWALAGANLRLARGGALLLAGRNGAGKTTLLRVLATVLPPTSGQLQLFGHDALRHPGLPRQRMALLSHATGLYDELSATENLRLVARILGKDEARIEGLLERVGLSGRGPDAVSGFSAGMRKRLAFARMLLQDPALILLDEPYGQLDPSGFAFVDRLVGELVDEGISLVISTHLVERMAPLLKSGLVLEGGAMKWVGRSADTPAALDGVLA